MLGRLKSSAQNAGWAALSAVGLTEALRWTEKRRASNPSSWFTSTRVALLIALGAPMLPIKSAKAKTLLQMMSVQAAFIYISAAYATPTDKVNPSILDRFLARVKADFRTK